jgi:hypothetical protein
MGVGLAVLAVGAWRFLGWSWPAMTRRMPCPLLRKLRLRHRVRLWSECGRVQDACTAVARAASAFASISSFATLPVNASRTCIFVDFKALGFGEIGFAGIVQEDNECASRYRSYQLVRLPCSAGDCRALSSSPVIPFSSHRSAFRPNLGYSGRRCKSRAIFVACPPHTSYVSWEPSQSTLLPTGRCLLPIKRTEPLA